MGAIELQGIVVDYKQVLQVERKQLENDKNYLNPFWEIYFDSPRVSPSMPFYVYTLTISYLYYYFPIFQYFLGNSKFK